jgi:carbon storage regulator CsrA
MLVMKRKPEERIAIGGNVVVTVLRVTPGGVTLGIDAPPEVEVSKRGRLEGHESPVSDAAGPGSLKSP